MTPTSAAPTSAAQTRSRASGPLVSILVNNFNYAEFVAQAIESALAQDYPNIEVVVVDDGSTDGSWSVIEQFADRARVVRQDNAGQPAAGQTGLDHSSGPIVLFLDADDFLWPSAVSRVVAAWQDGCAKVQFRLSLVGPGGVPFGTDPPWNVAMPSGDLSTEIAATGRYETPVTSGNAFPRSLLDRLFPFPEAFDALDHYLNTVVPLHGQVISIDDELGAYRQHTRNRWAFSGGVDVDRLRQRVRFDLLKEEQLRASAVEVGLVVQPELWRRNPDHLLHRLGSLRLDRAGHPQRDDSRLGLLRAGVAAIRQDSARGLADQTFAAGVLLAVAVAPVAMAERVLRWAIGGNRPQWLRRLARLVRRTGGTG